MRFFLISAVAVRFTTTFSAITADDLNVVGTDIRKVAVDGFPMQNLIACDLHGGKLSNSGVVEQVLTSTKNSGILATSCSDPHQTLSRLRSPQATYLPPLFSLPPRRG